jgi:predicted NBD/HSP70 family sugar kinase
VLVPFERLGGLDGLEPWCNCGRFGDLESLCSLTAIERILLPFFLPRFPSHPLGSVPTLREAAKRVRGMAEAGDAMCRAIFSVQARALGLFFDQMINTFDPDALIVGGGALEASEEFQHWFLAEIASGMPVQRQEQADIPIRVMPNGDTAGARGAALEALRVARQAAATR